MGTSLTQNFSVRINLFINAICAFGVSISRFKSSFYEAICNLEHHLIKFILGSLLAFVLPVFACFINFAAVFWIKILKNQKVDLLWHSFQGQSTVILKDLRQIRENPQRSDAPKVSHLKIQRPIGGKKRSLSYVPAFAA